ncbi:MAG: T9SS type B sorting domain-containing protein [Saprospiraceae bacterium]|nr:gliding motility-associated C-terminal domain-containing protein [Bacteroidia bacterium]NNE16349.1 T9SS type B sorting domain-containing protein [Saprospiraceae bacterium]NNL91031.1 T9SS type B sorting domain-containing protein [Saprospiraceae bacterium]
MNKRGTISLVFIALVFSLTAQMDPIAHFNFDDCIITDDAGTFNPGTITSGIDCECGVGGNSNALYFNNTADTVTLDGDLKSVFSSDFSIGFYLWVDDATMNFPVMSIQGDCLTARDSAFFIRYLPSNNEIVVELTKNFGEVIALRSNLETTSCWNHIMFTREANTYTLYINGQFIESFVFLSEVVLGQNFPFYIGVSPCVGVNDQYFEGRIDELKFFNYAIKEDQDLARITIPEDRIITQDTTIFEGTSFPIITGTSCVNQANWSPALGLSDPTDFSPIAGPTETTTYTLSLDHGTCLSQDEITISVLSQDQIECNNILLANAFTPNNDGLNDTYGISNDFIIENISRFEIYDRWGLKLFETLDKSDVWDGTFKGEKMPSGTYVYKIEYTCLGDLYRKTASFNILK